MRRPALALLLATSALVGRGQPAQAQESVAVNQYRAAPLSSDGFVVAGSDVPAHLSPDMQLHLEYSRNPLVFEATPGDAASERRALVTDQLTAHLVAALGLFDRFVVYGGLPVHLVLEGQQLGTQPSASGAGLGDVGLGGRVRLTDMDASLAVAVQLGATANTSERPTQQAGVGGESGPTVSPRLVLQWSSGPLRVMGNAGVRLRRDKLIAGVRYSDSLTYGLGAQYSVLDERLALQLEAFGATPVDDIGDRTHSPLELLGGGRLSLPLDLTVGLGAGIGLSRGVGAPDMRLAMRVGFRPGASQPDRSQSDHSQPGDRGEPPPRDTRARLVPRTTAAPGPAPAGPSDPNGHAEPTSTGPAPYASVASPSPAIDDAYQDADDDGTLDLDDTCPGLPGPAQLGGCPRTLRLDAGTGEVHLLRGIDFERGQARLRSRSEHVLEELDDLLDARPEVRLRLVVHVAISSRARNHDALGLARARTLRDWSDDLDHDGRVQVFNCASRRPGASSASRGRDGHVQAFILRPKPPKGPPSTALCSPL